MVNAATLAFNATAMSPSVSFYAFLDIRTTSTTNVGGAVALTSSSNNSGALLPALDTGGPDRHHQHHVCRRRLLRFTHLDRRAWLLGRHRRSRLAGVVPHHRAERRDATAAVLLRGPGPVRRQQRVPGHDRGRHLGIHCHVYVKDLQMVGRERRRHSTLARVGDLVLTVLAVGGTACVVLVPLAFFFDISLILFKTGSMGPTIPAGSMAVVREIPASEVHVGDVITVDRTPLPPITHRVVDIANGGGPTRLLTLRGDANETNDAAPHAVSHVRLVEWSVPRLGYAVRAVSNVCHESDHDRGRRDRHLGVLAARG